MLVLSRRKNESIVIDDNISIVIIEIRGDKVRLGIDAPKDVSVHRKEIFEAIHTMEMEEMNMVGTGSESTNKTDGPKPSGTRKISGKKVIHG